MHPLVVKGCIMVTLFGDFSERDDVVGATSKCYNNRTNEPFLTIFASI